MEEYLECMTKEEILQSTDLDELKAHMKYAMDVADDCKMQLEIADELDEGDDDWRQRAHGALATHRMTQKRCYKRLKDLGAYRDDEMHKLKERIAELEETCRNQRMALASLNT